MTISNKEYETNCFSSEWARILTEIANETPNFLLNVNSTDTTVNNSDYLTHDLLKAPVRDLDYGLSETYFTDQFFKELNKILDKQNFHKKTQHQKKIIQQQIEDLNRDEYEWKGRTRRAMHSFDTLLSLFSVHLDKFVSLSGNYFKPTTKDLESQRAHENYFKHKMILLVNGMSALLQEKANLKIIKFLDDITDQEYNIICKNYVSSKWIFIDLLKVILKKSHDNLFNKSNRVTQKHDIVLSEKAFMVDKTAVFYEFRRVLALSILTSVLNFIAETKKDLVFDYQELDFLIRDFIWHKQHLYDIESNGWWVRDHSNNTNSLLTLMEETGLFTSITREHVKVSNILTKRIKYILPTQMDDLIMKYTKLPNVFIPEPLDNKALDLMLKGAVFGENSVTKSDNLKSILTTAQNKRFSVNDSFVLILKALLDPSGFTNSLLTDFILEKLDLPFLSYDNYYAFKREVEELEKDLPTPNGLHGLALEKVKTEIVSENITNVSKRQIRQLAGISDLEHYFSLLIKQLMSEVRIAHAARKHVYSCVHIAQAYSGIPIYITNSFCVRLRLYPQEPLLARTSGVYKQLLGDYTPKKLTLQGLQELLRCYYFMSSEHLEEYEKFVKNSNFSKKTGFKKLFEFFKATPINFVSLPKGTFLYTSALFVEILTAELTGKTKINVEIDQTASASVFLALLLRNKKMASVSNLIGKIKTCPYSYCMNEFDNFYSTEMESKDNDAYEFLRSNRKIHKYALMCFCYSQTAAGRNEDFNERWFTTFKSRPSESVKKCLFEFAVKYPKFIELIFPKLTLQIDILKKVVDVVVRETGSMSLLTLNGEKIQWKRFKSKSITRKSFDPITKKHVPYRIETTRINETTQTVENDIQDHKVKILSYIIHSIDAAVMHQFIDKMKKQHNVSINTLHDCVLIHPNDVQNFYEVVKEVYSSLSLYNIAFTSIFEQARNSTSLSSKNTIDSLEKEFRELCDDFEDELKNFNPRNMYQPEH